ncbi:MAG: hypothetical protein KDB63_21130 [Nocardioidaceae bacterium]|nr:hypothetical protein [Nocardioidaceae bacterium]
MVTNVNPEANWVPARLIPTSGISGAQEQETRATSALLAVLGSVDEFGRRLTRLAGAPAGTIECFTEVAFKLNGTKTIARPDGLIRVSRGKTTWVALVEVKTGKNPLVADQLNLYLDVAREQGFDALITISNQISPNENKHPTPGIDGRKLRKLSLHHWSWSRLLSVAVMEKEHRGVSDPDQAWILGELIRYLEHPKSGALAFDDMGENWVSLRDAVSAGTLRASDKEAISEVTANWDALLRFAALHMGRRLGTEVRHHLNRKESSDPSQRQHNLAAMLVNGGVLAGDVRIPDTVGDITVTADLRAKSITCAVAIDAPKSGRNTTRINWLTRQLKSAPGHVRVEAFVAHQRGRGAAELLGRVREEPDTLLTDPSKEVVRFEVATMTKMGIKRGTGQGAFIDSVLETLDAFYADVVQHLKEWQAPPPKAPKPPQVETQSNDRDPTEETPSTLDSTKAWDPPSFQPYRAREF